MRGPETRLRKKMEKALKAEWPKGYFRKIHGNQYQNAGIPDLLCCVEGLFIALEVKTARGETTPIQEFELKMIRNASGYVAVVRTVQEAIDAVREAISETLSKLQKIKHTIPR